MKKSLNYLLVLALSLSTSISILSCDGFLGIGDNDENTENNGGGNGEGNNEENTNQPEADKEYIQQIAIEFMNEFNADDFEGILDLAEYINEEYTDKVEAEEAEEWLEDYFESIKSIIENENTYPIHRHIYTASNKTGKWVVENDRWKRYDSENLSIHVNDQNGAPCEIALTTSGNTKKVNCYYDEKWNDEEQKVEYKEEIWIEVPENVTIVLKQDGKKLLEIVVETDLSSMTSPDWNLSSDKYDVKTSVYFNNYSFSTENIKYENNKEVKVDFTFSHDNKTLLSVSVSATTKIDNLQAGYEDDDFLKTLESKNNSITIDILNKLKIKGTCNSFRSLIDVLCENWDEHIDSKVNRYIDINAYLNNSSSPTAKIEFECFEKDNREEYDDDAYYLEPIIVFNDNSRYSIEDFIEGEDFKNIIDTFETLYKNFEDLIYGYNFDL